jgi:aminoglycoside N3'-acetyltransferase
LRYTRDDIEKALLSNIKSDDIVFFSTSLGMVGLPPRDVKNQEDLNKLFLDILREILYDGIIVVPTYSYTFGQSLSEFKRDTPAQIGSFPNYCLKEEDAIRSIDPFTSVICIGKKSKEFLSNLSNISYGEGSIFEKLVKAEAKCCSIGLGPNWTPFIHYADYLLKVPHRYDKLFWGKINNEKTSWIYSVRFVGDESYPTAHIAGREAEKNGIWQYSSLGRARVYTANCKDYFNFVMEKLKKNRWYLAKGPAINVIEKEKRRINYEKEGQYITGEWIDNFLIPERWNYIEAKLMDENGKIISTTPWIHSISIDEEISINELKIHISNNQKNVFYNRDWGFVVKEELQGDKFQVIIKSNFGKGTVPIKNNFVFVEEWVDISEYNQNKKMIFEKGYFE